MLRVPEKVTFGHAALTPDDFAEVHRLGLSPEAINEVTVAYLFNIVNRMADALRFNLVGPPPHRERESVARTP